jgi:MFS superfamily sulfate permease-like transporter
VRAPSRISTLTHIILVLLLLLFFSVALERAISHPDARGFR